MTNINETVARTFNWTASWTLEAVDRTTALAAWIDRWLDRLHARARATE
jgi:hypothetical protein